MGIAEVSTIAELVQRQWGDHRVGLRDRSRVLSHHRVASGAAARAALLVDLLPRGAPPHVGVLLDNTPEFPLWLGAAALAGAAVVGINPTRRGAELARDITHTECRVLLTRRTLLPLLDGLDLPGTRVLVTDSEEYAELLAPYAGAEPGAHTLGPVGPRTRLLLCFTSGSTGAPKAAIRTQGRVAKAGHALRDMFRTGPDDVHYLCMPLFHGNAVIGGWAPALAAGASVALRDRFSASGFLSDVREFGATYFTYVGRSVQYLLATEERPDDRDHRLRTGFGTEAGAVDAARFTARFGVPLVEGYGSSEGGVSLRRTPGAPPGAIGRAAPGDDLAVVDPATGREREPAVLSPEGRLLNGDAAIGELVNRSPSPFEGYWHHPEAEAARTRDGWFWTGDLFFRDTDGYLHFAGRADDRIRVDGENLATALIEAILARWAGAGAVAVYPVPDPVSGDQVMVALVPAAAGPGEAEGQGFDPVGFAGFLAAQSDLGAKAVPRFVRIMAGLPVTATHKIHRAELRRTGLDCAELWWRPGAGPEYRPLTGADRAALEARYREHGRESAFRPGPGYGGGGGGNAFGRPG
ncbi:AMP-binding protein [Streptomyces sp. NPDC000594]|uniref:AMP-binding protein n=1 Tax=Streptomyces sp. NPDC000594 TaxID=3154261 RepID=UPI00331EE080